MLFCRKHVVVQGKKGSHSWPLTANRVCGLPNMLLDVQISDFDRNLKKFQFQEIQFIGNLKLPF